MTSNSAAPPRNFATESPKLTRLNLKGVSPIHFQGNTLFTDHVGADVAYQDWDETLIAWAAHADNVNTGVHVFFYAHYSPMAAAARQKLVDAGWTFTDRGPLP